MIKLVLVVVIVCLLILVLVKLFLTKKDASILSRVLFPTPTPSWVAQTLSSMTLEEKVGQMFIVGFQGTTLSPELKTFFFAYQPGGVILFSRNIQTQNQLATLNKNLQETATVSARIPFTIAIDEEGGNVVRIPWKHETTPQYGIKTPEEAFAVAKKRGHELAALGINVNFAPVVEPIQKDTSFIARQNRAYKWETDDKHLALIAATLDGYISAGIAAIPKHFPGGLGETTTDPHQEIPRLDKEKNKLTNEVKFYATIGKQSGALMVTHLSYPKISDELTSLSGEFIDRILRSEGRFDGMMVTDDLAMGALKNYSIKEMVQKGVAAGVDIFLISRPLNKQKEAIEEMTRLVKSGEVSEERLNRSVERILNFKTRLRE